MTTITIKDLIANAKRKHGNPIMGVGSKAAVSAIVDHADSVKDRDAFVAFSQSVLAALRERLTAYGSQGKTEKSAQVKMTSTAIRELDGFLATFTRVAAPQPAPVATPAPAKPVSRMTKAELIAMVEFLAARA
jgi:hypothetical protein